MKMARQKAEQKAVARKDISYWEYTRREMKRNWIAYVMILPYVVIFSLFTLCPVILSFVVGFTDFNMLQWPNFVWLENYINLFFADDIFLIACKAVTAIDGTEAFFVAAIIAVACGLCGDVMNDFKAGQLLETDPKAQWIAECIGGLLGAFVSVAVLLVIISAYGGDCFGTEIFPAAQAGAVAAMVGGISNMPAFIVGLIAGVILSIFKLPVMTLGLGVYLPFFMSATAFIGGALRLITDKAFPKFEENNTGTIIASGLLGGEGITGVIIALIVAVQAIV